MQSEDNLIIFTRYPAPGATKTRMMPLLGASGAADLQKRMTEHTLNTAEAHRKASGCGISVYYTGAERRLMSDWIGDEAALIEQADGDLGKKIDTAFRDFVSEHPAGTVIIGIDSPGITPEILTRAFNCLKRSDMVLGPARDGGYYLIGLNSCPDGLFNGIEWGSERTREQTMRRAAELGLSTELLDELDDIDEPDDIRAWEKHDDCSRYRISVVIPARNEAENIERTITAAASDHLSEVIVVDGGSTDSTVEAARSAGATVLTESGGRALQMNAGASAASGACLLFLHADTLLPNGYGAEVRELLSPGSTSAGAFQLSIRPEAAGTGFIETMVRMRSLLLRMPYGDQAIFLRSDTFRDIGGFRPMRIMEDYDIVRRLRRRGSIAISSMAVTTSARRWEKLGVLKTTSINQLMIAGYHLGIPDSSLAEFYRKQR
jgi:rSAM/selenodomain-associated transferase 2/rSAM/selenodomain-associated transferase 1